MIALFLVILIAFITIMAIRMIASSLNSAPTSEKKIKANSALARPQSLSADQESFPAKRQGESGKWIQPIDKVEVQGYSIHGGMFYLGSYLNSIDSSSTEPALINPSLEVDISSPDNTGLTMTYWPSYSNISPSARAAYLNWLSTGRNNSSAYIGYVFLFFYGLERRVLFDAQENFAAQKEIPAIMLEIKRLISIYGTSSGSFRSYATSFLNYISSYSQQKEVDFTDNSRMPYDELDFSIKRALGQLSFESKPIPADLAFAWFEKSPEIILRTPAKRCRNEFIKLFLARYKSEYGEGMVILPNKTILRCEYQPASASLRSKSFSNELKGIPDVTKLSRPIAAFQKIADSCMEDLDPYSRFLGKKQDSQGNKVFAFAQMPAIILREGNYSEITSLSSFLKNAATAGGSQIIEFSALLSTLGLPSDQPLTPSDSLLVAQLIGRLGFGVEPDIRFGGSKIIPSQKAVIFNLEDSQASAASNEYSFAALLLSFSSLIIHADGSVSAVEEEKLQSHVSSLLSLTKDEQKRIDALLKYLSISPSSFALVKKHIETLTDESKLFILKFIISIANADGNIDPSEIKILKKIYELFGKESNQIYSDIHSFQTANDDPVAITSAQQSSDGFAIPKKKSLSEKESGVSLDMELVAKTLQQTHQVQSLLSNIFSEKEEIAAKILPALSTKTNLIYNFDSSHSELFTKISSLDSISVDDFQCLCKQLDILPGGAIETINDACFDKVNDLYIEEDNDVLVLNKEIAKEMIA